MPAVAHTAPQEASYTPAPIAALRERQLGIGAMAFGLLAAALSLYMFPKGPPNTLAWWGYGLSVGLTLAAVPAFEGGWSAFLARFRRGYQVSFEPRALLPWAALGGILAFALVIRVYNLDGLPPGLWFDEADLIEEAMRIADNPGSTPVFVAFQNLPSLMSVLTAIQFELNGSIHLVRQNHSGDVRDGGLRGYVPAGAAHDGNGDGAGSRVPDGSDALGHNLEPRCLAWHNLAVLRRAERVAYLSGDTREAGNRLCAGGNGAGAGRVVLLAVSDVSHRDWVRAAACPAVVGSGETAQVAGEYRSADTVRSDSRRASGSGRARLSGGVLPANRSPCSRRTLWQKGNCLPSYGKI